MASLTEQGTTVAPRRGKQQTGAGRSWGGSAAGGREANLSLGSGATLPTHLVV